MLMSAWLTAVRNRMSGNRTPARRRSSVRPTTGLEDSLETRALLAAPTLVAVRPNVGDFLDYGEVRNVAPRELTLQFNPGQQIDNSNGRLMTDSPIVVERSNRDGVFDDGDNIPVTLGYVGLGANPEEVVVRFAENLPDDYYRITIRGGGTNPLQNIGGETFDSQTGVEDGYFEFRLNLAAQVRSVVPQPVTRNPDGSLTQARDQIVVYFNEDTLDQTSAEDPNFYKLYATQDTVENVDDIYSAPQSVVYSATENKAVLTFATDIDLIGGAGTYRLRIGTSEAIPGAPTHVDFTDTFYDDFGSAGAAFVSIRPLVSIDGNPIELDISTAALPNSTPAITVTNRKITIVLDSTVGTTAAQLQYGINLNPAAAALVVAEAFGDVTTPIGTTAGAQLFRFEDPGSSFDSAENIGVLGAGTSVITGQVVSHAYPFDLPGNSDEPGHREIDVPDESHLEFAPDSDPQIAVQYYNFQNKYGTFQGQALSNLITENQKARAREIFSLYAEHLGVQFVETENLGFTIVTGDLRAIDPTIVTGAGGVLGQSNRLLNLAIMDNAETWDDSYGGNWFTTAFHEIGHLLGLGHAFDLPELTVMGDVEGPALPATTAEPDFPGDADLIHGQVLYRPDSQDIDLYRFQLPQSGRLTAETIAERLSDSSLLDTVIRLYQVDAFGVPQLISQNDDYFSEDSLVNLELDAGTYYVGVSSTGNDAYDPTIRESGMDGTTQGGYELRLTFSPAAVDAIVDTDPLLPAQRFDGDHDGVEGGAYNFWFRAVPDSQLIVVDKANGAGTNISNIKTSIRTALAAASAGDVVRIVGNGGVDGDISTKADNVAYQIGLDDNGFQLPDGGDMNIPADVVLMIEAGAIIKFQDSYIGAGSSSVTEDRGGATLQVLGTPDLDVTLTSWRDESIGGNTTPIPTTPSPGNWGGIIFQRDVDNQEGRINYERLGIFMDYVAFASISYGGGKLNVDSVEQIISPISMVSARPGVYNNTIMASEDSALSADPDSFEETLFSTPAYQSVEFTPDYSRVGPDIHGNILLDNSNNGLFVRIQTNPGSPTKELTVSGRFDDRDIVHIISENLVVRGTPGGPFLEVDAPPVSLVTLNEVVGGGTLAAATYNYKIVYLDASGTESPASTATRSVTVSANGAVDLANLPTAVAPYVARRLYRSTGSGTYQLVATLNSSARTYRDTGLSESRMLDDTVVGRNRARLDASLVIDPNMVIKLEGARIEVGHGAQIIAEALAGQEIVITSRIDDRFGVGGTFDTNNDDAQGVNEAVPNRVGSVGLWGGIYLSPGASASIDHSLLTFGGNVIPTSGDFAGFNVIEAHQASLRVSNSIFEQNRDGSGGTAPADRFGYTENSSATIFARGAQPVLIDNVFRDNDGPVLSINANSFVAVEQGDYGRVTGLIDVNAGFEANRGPLVVRNLLGRNAINGIVVRGEVLTTETVWDDTDIVHVLQDEIVIPNFHTYGGLRLTSAPNSSLVVKLAGGTAGFTAGGKPLDIDDRIGGVLQIVGQPYFPVVLTSLSDDAVGAGFGLDGLPLSDTNNDGASTGTPGDWRSILISQYAHDRNVAVYLENEVVDATDQGSNATARLAEYLGELGRQDDVLRNADGTTTVRNTSDETLRLGYEVHGVIDSPNDVDVYSFTGAAGTEVWIDIDRTTHALDTVVELISSTGNIIALSDSSLNESGDPSLIYRATPLVEANGLDKSQFNSDDMYTTNPRDAGFRVILPGNAGTIGTYQVRVRSSNIDPLDPAAAISDLIDPALVFNGLTAGSYQLQIRLQETNEVPGTTVWYSDIRYATNGIEIYGQPAHSPLSGEYAEGTLDNNTPSSGGQGVGNILNTDRAAISIAGQISAPTDVDFYRFSISFDDIQDIPQHTNPNRWASVTFDVDYADGMSRANLQAHIYDASNNQLILTSRDSNISDDRSGALEGADMDDLSRGSVGELDPYIGPFELPEGDYYLVVAPHGQIPRDLNQTMVANPANPSVRLEPIMAVTRVIDEHFGGTSNSTAPLYQFTDDEQGQNTVQYHLGDVPLFVSDGQFVYIANSFTGTATNLVGNTGVLHQEIGMRPDGELFTWSTPNGGNDGSTGNYLMINTGNASLTNAGDDGIVTFHDSDGAGGAISVANSNAGMRVTAFAYTPPTAPGTNGGILVGTRGDGRYENNLIYQFNTRTGAAITQGPLRTGDGRVNDNNFSTPLSPNPSGADVIEVGVIDVAGTVTGISIPALPFVYGVTNLGEFFEYNLFTGAVTRSVTINNPATGTAASLTGLTIGPDEVEGGLYSTTMFASDNQGNIYALALGANAIEPTAAFGDLLPVFVDGQSVIATGLPAAGIAFGTLEYNLWALTGNRANDAGHGMPETVDGTRIDTPGGASLYFGNQRGGQPAGNKNDLGNLGTVNDYNFPGGAHGTYLSNTFSLEGYASADKPTLYFNYFLETDSNDYIPGVRSQSDAFRVYVGDGSSWSLVATNNSFRGQGLGDDEFDFAPDGLTTYPSGQLYPDVVELFDEAAAPVWRQARIDLSSFAGESELRLRFEFDSSGSVNVGDISTVGEELFARDGSVLRDGQSYILEGVNQFEFDSGYTLVAGSYQSFADGDTITVNVGGSVQVLEIDTNGTTGVNVAQLNSGMNAERIAREIETTLQQIQSVQPGGSPWEELRIFRNGNRINLVREVPVAPAGVEIRTDGIVVTLSGAGATLEGAPGVTVGTNAVVVHSGMSRYEVADLIASALADHQLPAGVMYETELNNVASPLMATDLEAESWTNVANNTIEEGNASPRPHISVLATSDVFTGTDFYRFEVPNLAGAQQSVRIDLDGITDPNYVPILRLLDSTGNLIVELDSSSGLDIGSNQSEAMIEQLLDPGEYYIQTGTSPYASGAIPAARYTLHVSVANHVVNGGATPAAELVVPRHIIKNSGDLVRVIGHYVTNAGPLAHTTALQGDGFGGYYDTLNTAQRGMNNAFEGIYIDDIIVGAAERGEMVLNASGNAPQFIANPEILNASLSNPNPYLDITVGAYDVEIRRAEDYASTTLGAPNPQFATINTNDRLADAVSIRVPDAVALLDGQVFTISDGVNSVTFEYEDAALSNGVGMGNYAILFDSSVDATLDPRFESLNYSTGESSSVIAARVLDAINSTEVQGILNIRASLADGTESSVESSSSSIINLYGNAIVSLSGVEQAPGTSSMPDGISGSIGAVSTTSSSRFFNFTNTSTHINPLTGLPEQISSITIQLPGAYRFDPHPLLGGTGNGPVINAASDFDSPTFTTLDNSNPLVPIFTFSANRNELLIRFDPTVVDTQDGPGFEVGDLLAFGIDVDIKNEPMWSIGTLVRVLWDSGREETAQFVQSTETSEVGVLRPISDTMSVAFHEGSSDQNRRRDQGQLLIQSNFITDSAQWGIISDAGVRSGGPNPPGAGALPHAGPVRNLREPNVDSLVPGVVISNNVVANGGSGGILFSGEIPPNGESSAPVAYGRIVNNTVVGNPANPVGTGIQVEQNSSPTLLNNIVADLATGISIDASSRALGTVLGATLYRGNGTNAATGAIGLGTYPIQLTATDPLFVDQSRRNYYPAPNSKSIDSSVDTLSDRAAIITVRQPLGIGLSPVQAPIRDAYGQLRGDDPAVATPAVQGANVFKDRGAIDGVDFFDPSAYLSTPLDQGIDDLEPAINEAWLNEPELLREIVVTLTDEGIGIDDAVIALDGSQFLLYMDDGVKQSTDLPDLADGTIITEGLLTAGVDYVFVYNSVTNEVIFRSTTAFPFERNYRIQVNNDDASVDGIEGVRDLAGNYIAANRADGTTQFELLLTDGINDPPVNSVPGDQTTPEDTALVFSAANANPISVSDADVWLGTNIMEVTLTVTNGTLTVSDLDPATNGLTFSVGDGDADTTMTFQGRVEALNRALAGLRFDPTPDYFGPAALTITTDDLGGFTGPPGAAPPAEQDTDTVNINVTAVNDPPAFDIPVALVNVNEDAGAVQVDNFFTNAVPGPSNETESISFSFTGAVISGAWTGTPLNVFFSSPLVAVQNSGTPTSWHLQFTTAADVNGTVRIDAVATDALGASSTVATFDIVIAAVNDAPVYTINSSITVNTGRIEVSSDEDQGAVQFDLFAGFAPGPATAIDEVGQSVTWSVNNVTPLLLAPISNLQFVSGTPLTNLNGDLIYRSTQDTAGSASLDMVLTDNGPVGGLNLNTAAQPVDITVNQINDAPVAIDGGPYVIDDGYELQLDASGSFDVDQFFGQTLSYKWDLNNDGTYETFSNGGADASFTVSWTDLASLGIYSPEVFDIKLLVSDDSGDTGNDTDTSSTTLETLIVDYGDSASSFGTLRADGGAAHTIKEGVMLYLGAFVDDERNASVGVNADGDDTSGAGDDEDGVTFPIRLEASATNDLPAYIEVSVVGDGFIDAWMDFDRNGVYDNTAERITDASGMPVTTGTYRLFFTVPAGTATGNTNLRVRVSSGGGLNATGRAGDGEVEDYVQEVFAVTGAQPPIITNPIDISPGNGVPQTSDSTPYIAWSRLEQNYYYDLAVYSLSDLTNPVYSVTGLQAESHDVATSLAEGLYQVKVTPYNKALEAGTPSTHVFEVVRVVVSSPSGDINAARPVIDWNHVLETKSYIVTINSLSENATLIQTEFATNGLPDPSQYSVGFDLPLGRYEAIVQARDQANLLGDPSEPLAFVVRTAPVVTVPAVVTVPRPQISWTPIAGAAQYEVELFDLTENVPVENASGILTTSWSPSVDLTLGQYSFRVRAYNRFGESGFWSTAADFGYGPQIGLVAPLSGRLSDSTPTFVWNAVPGADHYKLAVYENFGAGTKVIDEPNLTSTFFNTQNELPLGRYRYIVTAVNVPENGSSASDYFVSSGSVTFTQSQRPTMTSPLATTFESHPVAEWTVPLGAAATPVSDIWLNQLKGTRSENITKEFGVTGTEWQVPQSLGIGTYQIWVRTYSAVDTATVSDWSLQKVFRVTTQPETVGPAGRIADATPGLSWEGVQGGETYRVYLSSLSVAGPPLYDVSGLDALSFTVPTDLPIGRYRYWVQASSAYGDRSAWSLPQDFQIVSNPELSGPSSATFDTTPTFNWTDMTATLPNGRGGGASSYDFRLDRLVGSSRISDYIFINTTGTSYTIPAGQELPDGIYQAYVRANSADTMGDYSTRLEFFVGGRPVIQQIPTGTNQQPLIQWGAVDGASSYEIFIANILAPTNAIIREAGLASTTYQPDFALGQGTFRVWIRAFRADTGAAGLYWSKAVDFTIVSADEMSNDRGTGQIVLAAAGDELLSASTTISVGMLSGMDTTVLRPASHVDTVDNAAEYPAVDVNHEAVELTEEVLSDWQNETWWEEPVVSTAGVSADVNAVSERSSSGRGSLFASVFGGVLGLVAARRRDDEESEQS